MRIGSSLGWMTTERSYTFWNKYGGILRRNGGSPKPFWRNWKRRWMSIGSIRPPPAALDEHGNAASGRLPDRAHHRRTGGHRTRATIDAVGEAAGMASRTFLGGVVSRLQHTEGIDHLF